MRIAIDLSDNSIVHPNQFIKTLKGEWAQFISATRVSIPGKSGKITVKWAGFSESTFGTEYYDKVFNLCVIETDSITHFDNDLVEHWENLGVKFGELIASPEYQNFLQFNS